MELTLDDVETSPSSSIAVVDQPVRQTLVRMLRHLPPAGGLGLLHLLFPMAESILTLNFTKASVFLSHAEKRE